jgi:deoxyadenosine/deoxycytidine kinase
MNFLKKMFQKEDASASASESESRTNILAVIDGNIGGGKTTLIEHLRKVQNIGERKVVVVEEPVHVWEQIKDENGTPILKLFYENTKEHAFPFQMAAFISRLEVLKKAMKDNQGAIIVTERSLYTDRDVFAKMLFDSGDISLVNYTIYLKWFDLFAEDYPIHKQIYISANPEVCYERIKKRSRDGESNIQLDYLRNCHEYHENMLKDREKLVLDGNIDIFENESQLEIWSNSITDFILK